MKVKAKDIAKAAGVSTTAVSLVMNGKDSRISEATREEVLRIAREMKFQGEISVRPGSQRTKTLGLVLPDLEGPVFRVWMNKIQEYAFQKGYTVFCCTCGDDAVRCGTILESLAVKNVDGLVITVPSTLEKEDVLTRTLHTLQDNGVPFVLLDRAVYSIFSDFVTSDNKYGGRIAVEKLFQAGASRIGCVLGPEQVYTTKKRFQGFQEGMALHKAPYREQDVYHGSFTVQDGKKAFALLMAQGCDGLFVENERMTQGVLEAAAEQGLQIGQNLRAGSVRSSGDRAGHHHPAEPDPYGRKSGRPSDRAGGRARNTDAPGEFLCYTDSGRRTERKDGHLIFIKRETCARFLMDPLDSWAET